MNRLPEIVLIVFTVALLSLVGAAVWRAYAHPCLRWETSTCTQMHCIAFDGKTCAWIAQDVVCQVCVERAP